MVGMEPNKAIEDGGLAIQNFYLVNILEVVH